MNFRCGCSYSLTPCSFKSSLLAIFAILASVLFINGAFAAVPAPACGDNAKADIVIMIDRTGSIVANDIALEKAAAKFLLNSFSAAVVNRPRVAIGTFNEIDGPTPDARIVAGGDLTDVYGVDSANPAADSGLYEAINDIASPGDGFTNLSAAFDVAQAHLSAHSADVGYADFADYIIVISDGITNRPSSPTPSSCSSGTPGDLALAAATNAKATGTSIFTLHYGTDSPCAAGTGPAFLQQLASGPDYYIEANADLSGVFGVIADFIGCNDNDSCTTDTCNQNTHLCEFDGVDTDGDGTFDCHDDCPNDPSKTTPGQCGCGVPDTDSDNDGTANCNDNCPNDPNKLNPGVCGCGIADTDSDNDGTLDCNDNCPNDPNKTVPGVCGCGVADTDSDNDGTADCNDNCPNDPTKVNPGVCGCGVADTDSDNDGTANCNDNCPSDPNKVNPGICGCGTSDVDSDNDGTADCNDNCPNDPNKVNPGICGCGTSDVDSDNDETADCNDQCPNDPNKVNAGLCGCGVADTDSDNDGTPDCQDTCPNAAVDRCGVCGGDGQSCLGCNEVNITDTQFALDGNSLALRNVVYKATSLSLRLDRSSSNKKIVKSLRADADDLHQETWGLVWSVPNVLNVCANDAFCVNTSNASVITTVKVNSDSLLRLVNDALKRVKAKTKRDRKAKATLSSTAKKLHQDAYSSAALVPAIASSCS